MVRTSLKKNFIRGFKKNIVQLLSIIIMLTLGIAVFIGLDSTWRSLQKYVDNHYEDDKIADLTIYSDPVEVNYFEKLNDIDGIYEYEESFNLVSEVSSLSESQLEVNFIDKKEINKYKLIDGKDNLNKESCLLDKNFADSNNLKVSDTLELKINGIVKEFTIEGLIQSSSYIYITPDATSVIPDHTKYGYIYIYIDNINDFYGKKLVNRVNIRVNENEDVEKIRNKVDNEFKEVVQGVVKREEGLNYLAINQKVQQYKSIGSLFPIVFFAIVILMTFTTMYRIINKERLTIGILKSLGYSSRKILFHYCAYGLWISLIGIGLGTIIGWKIVPNFIWKFFEKLFVFESKNIVLSYKQVIIISIISLISTIAAISYVFIKTDKENPADLLREKRGISGKKVFIEKLSHYWNNRLPSEKLTIRQMLLNKVRILMTVIGVLGCTGLLLSALGIRDTVNNVAESVYSKTYLFKEKVYLNKGKLEDDIVNEVHSNDDCFMQEMKLSVESNSKKKMSSIYILENNNLIKFYDNNDNEIKLKENELLITEKIADIYSLSIGDKVKLRLDNENYIELTVSQISKINIGQGFYLLKETYENLEQTYEPNVILKSKISNVYDDNIIYKTVVTENQENDFVKSMESTISMSIMLILAAASLAIVVLYNLGVLNFADRERDMATLSVLGFYESELKKFLSVENVVMSFIGIILGIPVGILMHRKIFANAGMGDELDFTALIYRKSFIITIIFIIILVVVINFILTNKIKKIKMTEALKSVE